MTTTDIPKTIQGAYFFYRYIYYYYEDYLKSNDNKINNDNNNAIYKVIVEDLTNYMEKNNDTNTNANTNTDTRRRNYWKSLRRMKLFSNKTMRSRKMSTS
jgi:predicted metal-dependent hydrolase